ncbi:ABC transporter permease [Spirosoma luteum]|uniref:ABC transporter permease n=1 Tax=Spirosoma luteum TaxID=431553 RepID=UPI0003AA53C2|nr:ABC transporter permease [Spirosoma luteum]
MLTNYLKIAWRNLRRDRFYSLINILGLTIGITCGLLLLLYVTDELSYDRYHAKAGQIYRVVTEIHEPDKTNHWMGIQAPAVRTMKEKYPAVVNYVRFFPGPGTFQLGEKRFAEEGIFEADSTVFDIFSYNFVVGDSKTALHAPGSIVLTRKLAQKFFGTVNALGKILRTNDTTAYQVKGVIEDVPKNSQLRFNALTSLSNTTRKDNDWGSFYVTSYVVLAKNTDPKIIESKSPQLYEAHMASFFKRLGITVAYQLQPLTSIHLYSKLDGETNGDIGYVYTFSAVAFFMLLLASINYMNLATARSARRAKEVGLRKVMGSVRTALIGQFMAESVLMTTLALLVSVTMVWAMLPFFNTVSGKEIEIGQLVQPQFLGIALGIVVFTGFVSGSYPAFYLSAFEPAAVLKGATKGRSGSLFRRALVVTQFSVSLVMLICTWIVFQQLDFMQNQNMGYNREQVLTINYGDNQPPGKYETFRRSLLANPAIQKVATARAAVSNIGGRVILGVESGTGMKDMAFKPTSIDHNYLNTMGMKLVAGRDFSADFPADTSRSVLVNEATVKRMGWKEPLGKKVMLGSMPQNGQTAPPTAQVVGVVRDFHQQSLYNPIEPLILFYRPVLAVTHIKIAADDADKTLAFIKQKWTEVYPDKIFAYSFLDQDFESAYHADVLRGQIFTTFSVLTILIACLGLFGLATFTTEQRVKEIGVRKVLGASVWVWLYYSPKISRSWYCCRFPLLFQSPGTLCTNGCKVFRIRQTFTGGCL